MSKSKTTADELVTAAWCAALATTQASEKVPTGWRTTRELCKMLGRSDTRIGELLREAVLEGKCERRKFRVKLGGTVRPVPHYKLKK